MNSNNDLKSKPINKLLLSLALPAIIAQVVNILYNMVDRIYIGRLVDGTNAIAGLSVSIPIITLITGFTMLIGTGGAPIAAIKLGQKDQEGAEHTMSNSFSLLIVVGLVLTIIIQVFKKEILLLFGADVLSLPYGLDYVSIYALGTIFVQITLGMNSYINTQGFAKTSMTTVLIGAVLNIILDPIFIFLFNLGVKGAALATIIAQGVSCIYVLRFLFSEKSIIKIKKKYLPLSAKIILPTLALGISPFVMSATEGLLQISFNNQLSLYGGTMAVGTMAILLSIYQLITMPINGLCQGAQPIISYNYGAKDYPRVRDTIKLTLKVGLAYGLTMTVLILVFAKGFASIFTNDPTTQVFAGWALRVYLSGAVMFALQIVCQQAFLALNQAFISLVNATIRKVILLIPLIYLLPILLGNSNLAIQLSIPISSLANSPSKVFCVLLAEPVSDILAALFTSTQFYFFYRRKLSKDLH